MSKYNDSSAEPDDVKKVPVLGFLADQVSTVDPRIAEIYVQEKQHRFLELFRTYQSEPMKGNKQKTNDLINSALDAVVELKSSFDNLYEIHLQQLQLLSLHEQIAEHQKENDKQQPKRIKEIIVDLLPTIASAVKSKAAAQNGERKGLDKRQAAYEFLRNQITKITHVHSANYFANLLVKDSIENPSIYGGKNISHSAATIYTKTILEQVGRLQFKK